jgi:ribosomal protein S18 acetylase RimI-like enzyme
MSFDIRRVTSTELPAVRAALIETWHVTYDAIYGIDRVNDITARWHSLATLARQLDEPGSVFLLATNGSAVEASSYATRLSADVVHLYRLYVRPTAQRRGIGQRLMAATFAPFGAPITQRLEVEPLNLQAIAFYERAGFKRVGTTSDCGGSSGVPALIYERRAS